MNLNQGGDAGDGSGNQGGDGSYGGDQGGNGGDAGYGGQGGDAGYGNGDSGAPPRSRLSLPCRQDRGCTCLQHLMGPAYLQWMQWRTFGPLWSL